VKVSVLCPGWVNTRINEADRNRPPELAPPAERDMSMAEMGRQVLDGLLKSGLQPSEVAGRVFDAIREERFYILTHPDMTPVIEHRMQDILEGRSPAPNFFGA
jgi:NAD(P)-dependent dehydrogenase (short-subunit alcohol dehydrogenase family)